MPQTWNALKQRMKSHFVPPYYQRVLCVKPQTLKQGDKSVEAYYKELLVSLYFTFCLYYQRDLRVKSFAIDAKAWDMS